MVTHHLYGGFPSHGCCRPFHDAFARRVVPWHGARVIKAPDIFDYLVVSIRGFPDQEQISHLMEETGFSAVCCRDSSFGTAAIHRASKP